MAFNRRGLLGMIAGAPLFGGAVAESICHEAQFAIGAQQLGLYAGQPCGNTPTAPRMEHSSAVRMIFGDKEALAAIRDELFAEQRHVISIDPDILIMKAWSPMAKLTFQRQRNVERILAELQDNRMDRPQRYIRAFTDRLNKLMWA